MSILSSRQYEADYSPFVYEDSGGWSTEEKVRKSLKYVELGSDGQAEAGGFPVISDGKHVYVCDNDQHCVSYGLSSAGKTRFLFMPAIRILAESGENFFVNDPKGEIYSRLSGMLYRKGYNVIRVNFRDMNADCYNPLDYPAALYKSGRTDKAMLLLNNLVNTLAAPQKATTKDAFWPAEGSAWASATGAIMLDSYPPEAINLLNWADFNSRQSAELLESVFPYMPDSSTAKKGALQVCSSAENTLRSILVTAASFLSPFLQNDRLVAMMSQSSFRLEDLLKPKTALFLITDDTVSTADDIVSVMISQIQTFLVDAAFHSPSGKLDTRFNFIIDEFQSLSIPDMDKALATHRSRNIRYFLCVQSYAGLKARYPYPETLLANCGNIFFLGSSEQELLDKICALCGKTNISYDGNERDLVTPADLAAMKTSWPYKQVLYLNPMSGIRFCTQLPCIDLYDTGTYPPARRTFTQENIRSYTVSEYVADVRANRIPVAFTGKTVREILAGSGKQRRSTKSKMANIHADD